MSDTFNPKPTSEQLEELMIGYVLNALSPEETTEFERYLQAQPQLQKQVDDYQELLGLIAHVSRKSPAPEFRDRVMAITRHQPATLIPKTARSTIRWHWRKLGVAIAAIVLLGLAIDNYFLRRQVNELIAAHAHDDELPYAYELKGTAAAQQASAAVVINLNSSQAFVGIKNLPALPPGEIYRLWAFTENKKILCGEFNTSPTGELLAQISIPAKEYTTPIQFMRISREPVVPSAGPQQRVLVLTSET